MEAHEFVCADCEANVFSFIGVPDDKLCAPCKTIRDMKASAPMTAEAEATLREMLGCVIPIKGGVDG